MTDPPDASFQTVPRSITDSGNLEWGTTDGEQWSDALETSNSVTVSDDGSVQTGVEIPDSVVAQSDLIAWYPFENNAVDETVGDSAYGDATDYSGSVNGATTRSDGGVNDVLTQSENSSAYVFDSDNDYILINSTNPIPNLNEFTVSFWSQNNGNAGRPFYMRDNNLIDFRQHSDGSGYKTRIQDPNLNSYYVSYPSVEFDTYYHYVLTYDGSTLIAYFDGSQVDSNSVSTSIRSPGDNDAIGARGNSPPDIFADTTIDDVRIYSSALTASQVSNHYNATKP